MSDKHTSYTCLLQTIRMNQQRNIILVCLQTFFVLGMIYIYVFRMCSGGEGDEEEI